MPGRYVYYDSIVLLACIVVSPSSLHFDDNIVRSLIVILRNIHYGAIMK